MRLSLEESFARRRESVAKISKILRGEAKDLRELADDLEQTAVKIESRVPEPEKPAAPAKTKKRGCKLGAHPKSVRPKLSVRLQIQQLLDDRGPMKAKEIANTLRLNAGTVSGTLSDSFERVGDGLWQ